ncbi:MAG: rod-binding protein [Selenomonas sp.]|jgi:flagellar protein FlgJ|nr:rod-binding protein [Selenomonas sp.]
MQIAPLTAMTMNNQISHNTTYDSAQTAADSVQFKQKLKALTDKTAAAEKSSSVEAGVEKKDKELKEACKGFEAMFLSMMYKEMRATVPEDKLFGESNGQKIFQDMQDTELMKNVADSGGVGLADMMYRQLSPQVTAQEKAVELGALKAQQAAARIKK